MIVVNCNLITIIKGKADEDQDLLVRPVECEAKVPEDEASAHMEGGWRIWELDLITCSRWGNSFYLYSFAS